MADWLQAAGDHTATVVAAMGRASTPAVQDRGTAVQVMSTPWPPQGRWPVLAIGAVPELEKAGIDLWRAHPNVLEGLATDPGRFRALVVDCRDLGGLWSGALSGAAQWKTDLIYQTCVVWRGAGLPTYLIRPAVESVPSYRWSSVSTATFPWAGDDAEDTGNPSTPLWQAMEKLGERQ